MGELSFWVQVRIAFEVARTGTIAAAARELGVHRATINRHIDGLEDALKAKLFLRNHQGYTLTDAGRAFLAVAGEADQSLDDFRGLMICKQGEVSNRIVVTATTALSYFLMLPIKALQAVMPEVTFRVVGDDHFLKLEHGDAHVGLRLGPEPEQDDYVVQRLGTMHFAIYAHESYIAAHGMPSGEEDLQRHITVCLPDLADRVPVEGWLMQASGQDDRTIWTTSPEISQYAVLTGAGVGVYMTQFATQVSGLRQVVAPRPEWDLPIWLVTHVDIHRTPKIQAVTRQIKESWSTLEELAQETEHGTPLEDKSPAKPARPMPAHGHGDEGEAGEAGAGPALKAAKPAR